MAVVDMPLAELQQYKGINPRPDDFDQYWDKAICEMKAVEPNVEITRSEFQVSFADCFDMYFTGVRGARIYAKLLKPKDIKRKCPALLEFHGYSGSSGDWFSKLPYVAEGFIVASLDCRGQGGSSEDSGGVKGNTLHGHIIRGLNDKPENLLFRQIFLDTAQLASIVMGMDEVDETKVAATGGSQGGALTTACGALEPRIKKLAITFPFLSDYKRVLELDFETEAYIELRDYFRRYDPLHEQENEIFSRLGYIDVHNLAKKIKSEVLFTASLRDNICPPSTQFAVYNNIDSSKQMLIYHDFGHEGLPLLSDKVFDFLKFD
ncbi:MAG: acetylxylan esterase [Phycisphaerae bacterium]|nr:acetylxylan esterase [Phycisphaerae bacterium]